MPYNFGSGFGRIVKELPSSTFEALTEIFQIHINAFQDFQPSSNLTTHFYLQELHKKVNVQLIVCQELPRLSTISTFPPIFFQELHTMKNALHSHSPALHSCPSPIYTPKALGRQTTTILLKSISQHFT